jgi:hypothetical protein
MAPRSKQERMVFLFGLRSVVSHICEIVSRRQLISD